MSNFPISITNFLFTELDDGKILTGNPVIFDGKNQFSGYDFPLNQSIDLWILPSGNLT